MTTEEANAVRAMVRKVEDRVEKLEFQHNLLVGQVDNLVALIREKRKC